MSNTRHANPPPPVRYELDVRGGTVGPWFWSVTIVGGPHDGEVTDWATLKDVRSRYEAGHVARERVREFILLVEGGTVAMVDRPIPAPAKTGRSPLKPAAQPESADTNADQVTEGDGS